MKHDLVAVTMADMNMTQGVVSRNYDFRAVYHYNAAIQCMTRGRPSIESLLLASILALLYETLDENAETSLIHLGAARRITQGIRNTRASWVNTSGLVDLVEKVNITAKQGEAHTRQTISENLGSSPESSSSSSTEGERSDWAVGTDFESVSHSIEILEFCMKPLLDSNNIERETIARVIIRLNRWIVAYRRYEPTRPETMAEARIVLRLYNAIFALIQLRLYHASEGVDRRCDCDEKAVQISS